MGPRTVTRSDFYYLAVSYYVEALMVVPSSRFTKKSL